ncbi:hypothetical protein JCM8097_004916 [Rhodosporidiobolus ruineniae]
MSSTVYLITGASRGLGRSSPLSLATSTQALLASSPSVKVVATARDPDKAVELKALAAKKENEGRLLVVQLDVSDEKSVETFATEFEKNPFAGNGIDCLVNNAGCSPGGFTSLHSASTSELRTVLETNIFGAIWVTKALLPLLRRGQAKQLVFISSIAGSLGGPVSQVAACGTYAISKAALNMAMRKFAAELALEGFTTVSYHPGFVDTDMNVGAPETGLTLLSRDEAAEAALTHLFRKLTPADNSKFLAYDGTEMPW